MRRRAWSVTAAGLGVLLVSACGMPAPARVSAPSAAGAEGGTHYGAPAKLGNGTVRTYVTTDPAGNPGALGVELSRAALDGLPEANKVPTQMLMLDLPAPADRTGFHFVELDWESRGHPPAGVFDVPHFDVHFYLSDHNAVMSINPNDPNYATEADNLPPARYMPAGYHPENGGTPAQMAVPMMGVHWLDRPDTFVPNHYNFTHTLVNGSWNGQYTFLEPMITRAFLLSEPPLTQEPVPHPPTFTQAGYFPTTYRIEYDRSAAIYRISLDNLAPHPAN